MNCETCFKPQELCLCAEIKPQTSQTQILILQHPQEPDKELGTALLSQKALSSCTLKVGLSWPNLKAALGKEASPAKWAVVYLGSGVKGGEKSQSPLQFVSKKGLAIPAVPGIEGFVILDGTWSQAKALWWRNAWLLKLRRVVLQPKQPSLYKELRKEPRRECLSTLESIAEVLDAQGEAPAIGQELRRLFSLLLNRKREMLKARRGLSKTPEPAKNS